MSGSRVVLPAKAVGDTTRYQIDFLSQLSEGESLASATCTLSVYCGSDSSPSDMLVGEAFLLGTKVVQIIQAGERGVIYQLTVTAVTDLSQILVIKAYLACVDPDSAGGEVSNECCPRIGVAETANGRDFTLEFPLNPVQALTDGLQLFVIFGGDATNQVSNLTLNVDSLGAKDIYWNRVLAATGYEILTDDLLHFVFDETADEWNVVDRPRMQDYCLIQNDQTQVITTGTGKATLRALFSAVIVGIRGFVTTASSSGNVVLDVNLNGTTIMSSNKLVIEANETTTLTAATQPALTTRVVASGDVLTVDVDSAGTNAAGWGVLLNLRMTH